MLEECVVDINPTIFRAYDIRGVVGKTLTEESVYLIGQAIGSLTQERGDNQIVIARDGRHSGVLLSQALCNGILASGCDVIDIGMAPTPLLYFAVDTLEQHSGVMLTGSHNPPEYNGLKMVVRGVTLAEADIQLLYQRIKQNQFRTGHGVRRELDVCEKYIKQLTKDVYLARSLKVVIDAGNGVAGHIAPTIFKKLGCEVQELYCDVDGNFPNHHPDPSQPENLQDLICAVREARADIGLAFDGDGDRLGVVTSKGEIIWPDRLLMLFAQALLAELPKSKIIYDVKCSNLLATLIRENNGEPIMWKTGHSLIKAKMADTQAQLAGEMSGHFFFKDRWNGFDDAIYAAARLLEILAGQEQDSASVFASIPNSVNTPELKVQVSDHEKFKLMQKLIANANFSEAEVMTIDGLRVNFADGWGLVRPSNTTPYLILRFEAANQAVLERIQLMFKEWMLSVEPGLALPF